MMEYEVLSIHGKPIDTEPNSLGELRSSADAVDEFDVLRARFEKDGYLYLPRLLDVDTLASARLTMLEALAELDFIDTDFPLREGIAKRECNVSAREMVGLSKSNEPLRQALYSGPMIAFYEKFLGGPVRGLDFTWCRVKSSGTETATNPHYDIVFMGRGTKNLYTSWTPLGDTPREMGGLMILEDSHRLEEVKSTYGQSDVDVFCTNEQDLHETETGQKRWQGSGTGTYANDAIALREELNSRWLTTDYELGDVLVFSMYTMHASMDNLTNRLRLSTDTRYQLASEPVDERWIGENPIAHGPEAKKGIIC
ncbi:MAG: phytanoyl-CoA dioxygenase family protein [Caldilineaceae bacterium]|nr:phytanoyl-CoA dioxygenase family protein [Caldilineaceae bacterium]